nr:hypothetical protein GCM10025699_75630 [Microbacterium flavescens]
MTPVMRCTAVRAAVRVMRFTRRFGPPCGDAINTAVRAAVRVMRWCFSVAVRAAWRGEGPGGSRRRGRARSDRFGVSGRGSPAPTHRGRAAGEGSRDELRRARDQLFWASQVRPREAVPPCVVLGAAEFTV